MDTLTGRTEPEKPDTGSYLPDDSAEGHSGKGKTVETGSQSAVARGLGK